jgi:hypothetical protein
VLRKDEWVDLPPWINFDQDHGMSVKETVGSGRPYLGDDGNLHVEGTYTSLPRGQELRTLVNEGHIRQTSVAFMTTKTAKAGGQPTIKREVLNGAFVAVPSNTDARVLASKAVDLKVGARNSSSDAAAIQVIHDATVALGATCEEDDPDADEPGGKSVKDAVSNKPWSDITQADYTIEQWRRACLVGPDSPSDSKEDYSLPVREPDGTLNRNAVHAAAGRLNQVQASPADKAKAARTLVGLYRDHLHEDPPDSLTQAAGKSAQDTAAALLSGVDLSTLPEPVSKALAVLGIAPDTKSAASDAAAAAQAAAAASEAAEEVAVRARAVRMQALSLSA